MKSLTKSSQHKLWSKFNSDSCQHKGETAYIIMGNKDLSAVTGITIVKCTDPNVKKIKSVSEGMST
jgi:hypothetical protein